MSDTARNLSQPAEDLASDQALSSLLRGLRAGLIGRGTLIERLTIGLLTGGHILLEGPPGLAKTRSVKLLAEGLDISFARIQCTPDLMPARSHRHAGAEAGSRRLRIRRGAGVSFASPGRRDQPRTTQGAVGAARGDGRAAGHGGGHDARSARPVHGGRHPEFDRARGYFSVARGAARPVPDARAARPSRRPATSD